MDFSSSKTPTNTKVPLITLKTILNSSIIILFIFSINFLIYHNCPILTLSSYFSTLTNTIVNKKRIKKSNPKNTKVFILNQLSFKY
ncbi:hypothetical protein CJD_1610 [Clostridium perfringens D str. JGS1721]|uniref:Uncharacterized protein n=1 Tax=Clostridium perfringens D str. JGS1721 TaxID=488537 RepID=B1V543_CLOPF|nr:hypothetical protein CJD_1610 [Clostridium perfringens D str. JGS1721]